MLVFLMRTKFKNVLRFDPFLCSQEYTSEKLNLIEAAGCMVHALPKKGLLVRLASFINAFYRLSFQNIKKISPSTSYHILVANNDNELKVLKPIADSFSKDEILWLGLSARKLSGRYLTYHPISGYLLGILFIPLVLAKIVCASDREKSVAPYIFDQLLYAVGFLIPFELLLNKIDVKGVYVSNHNAPLSALLLELCADEDIKTTYIEHTVIVSRWPEIKCDNFLLSGKFSKFNLDMVNMNRQNYSVALIGSPKNDGLIIKKNNINIRAIGIGINVADDIQKVVQLVRDLNESLPNMQLYLRPHPSMKLHVMIIRICAELGVHLSPPATQSLNKFFNLIDVLVVNDSGLYFEAGYAGVVPLKFHLSVQHSEYTVPDKFYKGLFEESAALVLEIRNLNLDVSDLRLEFKEIYHNIGTEFDQNSFKALKHSLDKFGIY